MALVVEDGTGKTNATSYVTLADVRAYATARGTTLSGVDAALEAQVIRAMDYIEAFRDRFTGSKYTKEQSLQWPREGASVDGFDVEVDEIPQALKNAECQVVIELQTVDPTATTTGPGIKQETVGPLTTVYAISDNANPLPRMPKVDDLLDPLLKTGFGLSTVRV